MKAFIVDTGYDQHGDGIDIHMFGRLENGDSFVAVCPFTPYFFIRKDDLKKVKNLLKEFTTRETGDRTFDGQEVIKIEAKTYTDMNKLSNACHKMDVNTYEADLKPEERFKIDADILGLIDIQGDHETAEKVDRVYRNPDVRPISLLDHTPDLKVVSLDIETDKNGDELYCIGLYSDNYEKVFIKSKKKLKYAVSCNDESELLENFKDALKELDPDIITGYHVIDFDLAFLRKKFAEHKLQFDIGRTNANARLRVSEDFFRQSRADVPGRQVLDALNLIRDPFIKEAPSIKGYNFESYTLEDVSQAILGEGKTIKGKKRYKEIDRLYKEDPKELVKYNLTDCRLAYEIVKKTKTIELSIERATLTGMPLNRIGASIAAFDSLYIREARKRGLVSPTTFYDPKRESITGGYVMESKPGIYHNVLVLDFKSLYPSIIKTFNIDPASYLENKRKDAIESPNKAYFLNKDGILPQIIGKLHDARERAKTEKRKLSPYAIKIIMNSFFGVLASPNCRYFNLKMANAITHFGQHIIKLTAKKIEEKGSEVLYSDTDSVFIDSKKDEKESRKLGCHLQDYINDFYNKHVKKEYNRTSYLELEYKKLYLAFLMPPIRRSEKASKKRYAGLVKEGKKERIEITGLEAIRGDWTEAAQDFQRKLLDKIFHKEEFVAFIRRYVQEIQEGKLDDKLVYRKSITKPLSDYVKTTPPHVKAARKLDKLDSRMISYYITTDGPEPVQALKHTLDYEHYIQKQIAPIANAILFFFDKDFDEIVQTSKQMKLF